jgi:hypothetical protein
MLQGVEKALTILACQRYFALAATGRKL